MAKLVTIFLAFFTKLNKIKKALKFSLLKTINGSDGTSINSTSISSQFSLSGLLSELNSVSLKSAIYWVVFS